MIYLCYKWRQALWYHYKSHGKESKEAYRCYIQHCRSTLDVPGLSVPGQKLADCSVLSANHGAEIPLWTSPRFHAPSAQCTCCINWGNFSFQEQASVGHHILFEYIREKHSNLRCTSDPIQIIQKNKNYCTVKTKACSLTLPKKQAAFFFFLTHEHAAAATLAREKVLPTVKRHRARFISHINLVSYARDNLAHIALS